MISILSIYNLLVLSGIPLLLGQLDSSQNPNNGEQRKKEFEEQALPHINLLFSSALRFTRRPEDAEDLVQETYLRAFRFFHQFEKGTNIRAWL